MTSNDNEDPSVPGGKFPAGQGPEDRTMPSGKAKQSGKAKPEAAADGLDRTLPAGGASEDATIPSGNAGGASEDATMPSGNANGDSENPTIASGSASGRGAGGGSGGAAGSGGGRPAPAASGHAYDPGELMGKTIGGCRVDKLLGRGAMGAVYKARQLKLDRDVAVKVIRPEMMTDPRMLKRFQVEARTVGKFNSANVVMVHDVGFELGVHYLVMEFVEGRNLREHVKLLAGGRLPAGEALPLIRQACKGLEEARRLKVVHRDIKPDNLMLTTQNILKIADFGIAKPEEDFSMTLTSELIGTPLYMSPEQCQGGGDVDFRSDMYSLGATFFYLLTGEPPIRASSVYELIQTKTKLENLCLWKSLPELDENHPLSRVIERMTANHREDRYDSYEELLNDLLLVEAGETITVRAKRIKKDSAEREGRRVKADKAEQKSGSGGLMVVLLLLVVAGGGGGYWWWSNQAKDTPEIKGGGGGQGAKQAADSGNSNVVPGPDLSVAQVALAGFRERLVNDGPSETLSSEIANLPMPDGSSAGLDALTREFALLQRDVDYGVALKAALANLSPPEPVLPFAGIPLFLDSVSSKIPAAPADAGDELRNWAAKFEDEKLREAKQMVGAKAVASLEQALERWRNDLEGFRGVDSDLQSLQGRMIEIRDGREALVSLLPAQEPTLDQSCSIDTLDELSLKLIRFAFLSGGSNPSLTLSAEAVLTANAKLREERSVLLSAMELYGKTEYPTAFASPEFAVVAPFRRARSNALAKAAGDLELPEWLVASRQQLLREQDMLTAVVGVCGDDWQRWQTRQGQGVDSVELQTDLDRLRRAVANAKKLFPGPEAAAALDKAVPAVEIEAASATIQAAITKAGGDAKRELWRAELKAAERQLGNLSLALWNEKEFRGLAKSLQDGLSGVSDREQLALGLKQFTKGCDEWQQAKADYDKASGMLADGALLQCIRDLGDVVPPAGAKREFEQLASVAKLCREAFERVDQNLDVDGAKAKLAAAKDDARDLSLEKVATTIEQWYQGVLNLESAATGMVPIAAGNSKQPRTKPVKMAFFMSATECSVEEFRQFVNAANAMELAAATAKLPSFAGKESMLRSILNKRLPGSGGRKPVSATWYEAAAYCEWNMLSLPTLDEWALAVYGDGGRRELPWAGNETEYFNSDCNFGRASKDVDDGAKQIAGMYHVVGNVAEWLFFEGQDFKAQCVGGGFLDTVRAAGRYVSGDELRMVDRQMGREDVGFRPVLRLSSFGGMTWPKDWRK